MSAKKAKTSGSGKSGTAGAKGTAGKAVDAEAKGQGSRVEAYRRLAERFGKEAAVPLPGFLSGQARREHVRACLLEDHAERIAAHADGTVDKFAKLAGDQGLDKKLGGSVRKDGRA